MSLCAPNAVRLPLFPTAEGRLKNIEHSRSDLGRVDFGINWSLVPVSITPSRVAQETFETAWEWRYLKRRYWIPDFPTGVEGSQVPLPVIQAPPVTTRFEFNNQMTTLSAMRNDQFFVYIVASLRRAIYTGMTKDISVRVQHHKSGRVPGFSSKYRTTRLVCREMAESFEAAREREAQIKRWRRSKKIALIEAGNPHWIDLSRHLG